MWGQQTERGVIDYVRKHTSQLVCTCSEDTARDAVWASSLEAVNKFKCFTHVGLGEGEGGAHSLLSCCDGSTILSSKRAKKVFSLSGNVTLVSMMWLVFLL